MEAILATAIWSDTSRAMRGSWDIGCHADAEDLAYEMAAEAPVTMNPPDAIRFTFADGNKLTIAIKADD